MVELKPKGTRQFELCAAGYPTKDGGNGKIITLEIESERAREILVREIHMVCCALQASRGDLQPPKMRAKASLEGSQGASAGEMGDVLGAITTTAQNFKATI